VRPVLDVPVPDPERAQVVVEPPGDGEGHWAGAPSAVRLDGTTYLAYRLRRPVGEGRGHAVVVARSADGVSFETLDVIEKEQLGAESLERPALVPLPGGGWRLYLSGATPGTLHWWVDALDAVDPSAFSAFFSGARRRTFPGDERTAMKDPVVRWDGGQWQAWVCCHPLGDAAEADRMSTRFATSDDGLGWRWHGVALDGRPGRWDQRGVRITSVVRHGARWVAYYDGRASAAENFEERTGIALGDEPGRFQSEAVEPIGARPDGSGALRYVCLVPREDGSYRLYYEARRSDGAHELVTEVVTQGAGSAREVVSESDAKRPHPLTDSEPGSESDGGGPGGMRSSPLE
jgi:hypothetical protein